MRVPINKSANRESSVAADGNPKPVPLSRWVSKSWFLRFPISKHGSGAICENAIIHEYGNARKMLATVLLDSSNL